MEKQEVSFNGRCHRDARIRLQMQRYALDLAEQLRSELLNNPAIARIEFAGETRRFAEIIRQIDLVVQSETLSALPDTPAIANLKNAITDTGMQLNIRFARSENFIATWHETTGSSQYINAFNEYANSHNARNFAGIESEEAMYSALGLQFVPPEIREDAKVLRRAVAGDIPQLIENSDLRGMLHIHTNASDGKNSLEEMMLETRRLGFKYVAICDHSQYAAHVGGLTPDEVLAQSEEIDRLNEKYPDFRILKGIESDILPDGSLDYTPEFLAHFDIVVASIHSSFKMPKAEMTARIIRAARNPFTTILGHPTGRLIGTPAGYEIDIDEFINVCADCGKVIEINANPYRLDFNAENAMKAAAKGVKLAINPDSHKTQTLADVFIGVQSARKAWLTAEDVINCLTLDEFIKNYVRK